MVSKIPLPFVGNLCNIDTDECLLNPCINGHCLNNEGSFTCDCDTGYEGKNKLMYMPAILL